MKLRNESLDLHLQLINSWELIQFKMATNIVSTKLAMIELV